MSVSLRVLLPVAGGLVAPVGLAVAVSLSTSHVNSAMLWASVAWVTLMGFAGTILAIVWKSEERGRVERIDRKFDEREKQRSAGVKTSTLRDLLYWVDKLDEDVADENVSPEQAFAVLRTRIQGYLSEEPGLRLAPDNGRDTSQ